MNWLVLIALLLCGCAETRIYTHQAGEPKEYLVACIQGDCTNVTITWPGGSFHADTLNHSTATAAAYTGGAAVLGAAGVAAIGALKTVP